MHCKSLCKCTVMRFHKHAIKLKILKVLQTKTSKSNEFNREVTKNKERRTMITRCDIYRPHTFFYKIARSIRKTDRQTLSSF